MQQHMQANQGMIKPQGPHFENDQTLYIGNLPANTYDNDVFKHFSSKGHQLVKVKVIVD